MFIPDRVYAQYRNKPKAVDWFAICRKMGGDIESAAQAVKGMYDIDTATSAQLDIIGRIVVAPRSSLESVSMNPTTFGSPSAQCGGVSSMCAPITISQDAQLSSEMYRIVIKAKIIRNNSDATIESILDGLNFIFPMARFVELIDGENMSFSLRFDGALTPLEQYVLTSGKIMPKPQGVRFNGFFTTSGPSTFGNPAAVCGSPATQCIGYLE